MPFGHLSHDRYDLALVGTGFASTFFLHRFLQHAPPDARVAVLERGTFWDHARRVRERRNSPFAADNGYRATGAAGKPWVFTLGFGGGSNCWWANTPRMLPDDFQTRSRFGVGHDWPILYGDLAPFYDEAEAIMAVSGPADGSPAPRARGFPQPPHRMNGPERLLKRAYPDAFFAAPTARARVATRARPACCGNGVCHLCPVDAKFTVENGLMDAYRDPRVTVVLEAPAEAVETAAGRADAVVYRRGEGHRRVRANLVALGANALFNPVLLERSGLHHPLLGRRLHEQVGLRAEAFLDGVDGFDGSTSVTGHGYMLYDDPERRRTLAAGLIETWNVGLLRRERGRWRQVLPVRLVFEDLPLDENRVRFDPADPARPEARTQRHSAHLERALARAERDLERVLAPLPVERLSVRGAPEPTEAHIMGTTVMGRDPANSVVDPDGVHHAVRNLLVLGGSLFPSGAPANPTLTIAALSLRAAARLHASGTAIG